LAACPFFSAERHDFTARLDLRSDPSRFEILIVLSGSGAIGWGDRKSVYRAGDCWFIPASQGEFSLHPQTATGIVRSTVPDLSELRAEMHRNGMALQEIDKVLFA
jgi:mannose-6-phosphate isomerase class I